MEVSTPACAAILHRDGAHLTSWIPAGGDDLLWTSAEAVHAEGAAIRGGIPLIGPWFGPGRDGRTSPAHGWLRTHRWDLIAAHRGDSDAGGAVHGDGDVVTLELELRGADPTGQGTSAALAVVLSRESLQVTLTVTAGTEPLVLEAALHTYLAVSDVRAIELE
ncbi:MAG: D-hexose-6-phosphate mutarotase, partial [Brachybacterium sp.]|nr:D-hexose-6-phosphate mutarotase [Brachybacterium sp.]